MQLATEALVDSGVDLDVVSGVYTTSAFRNRAASKSDPPFGVERKFEFKLDRLRGLEPGCVIGTPRQHLAVAGRPSDLVSPVRDDSRVQNSQGDENKNRGKRVFRSSCPVQFATRYNWLSSTIRYKVQLAVQYNSLQGSLTHLLHRKGTPPLRYLRPLLPPAEVPDEPAAQEKADPVATSNSNYTITVANCSRILSSFLSSDSHEHRLGFLIGQSCTRSVTGASDTPSPRYLLSPAAVSPIDVADQEKLMFESSKLLFEATNRRAYFKSVYVLLPATWEPSQCSLDPNIVANAPHTATYDASNIRVSTYDASNIRVSTYDASNIRVTPGDGVHPGPYTLQSKGCGEPGEYISLSASFLKNSNASRNEARLMVREWAKFRYGVFDEVGYHHDPMYPEFYTDYVSDGSTAQRPTACTDLPLAGERNCHGSMCSFKPDPNANVHSSLMSFPQLTKAHEFCNDSTHNADAPTKQNLFCEGRSTWDVISTHNDIFGNCHGSMCSFKPDPNANVHSSLMSFPQLTKAHEFCNDSTHNADAPTKQNLFCEGRSTWDVISTHNDIFGHLRSQLTFPPRPSVTYMRPKNRRIVFLLQTGREVRDKKPSAWKRVGLMINLIALDLQGVYPNGVLERPHLMVETLLNQRTPFEEERPCPWLSNCCRILPSSLHSRSHRATVRLWCGLDNPGVDGDVIIYYYNQPALNTLVGLTNECWPWGQLRIKEEKKEWRNLFAEEVQQQQQLAEVRVFRSRAVEGRRMEVPRRRRWRNLPVEEAPGVPKGAVTEEEVMGVTICGQNCCSNRWQNVRSATYRMLGLLSSSSSYNAPEVGLVEYTSGIDKVQPVVNLKSLSLSRSLISRYINDKEGNCIVCGIREALKLLQQAGDSASGGEIVVVSQAPYAHKAEDLKLVAMEAIDRAARIHVIIYGGVKSPNAGILREMAKETGGHAIDLEEAGGVSNLVEIVEAYERCLEAKNTAKIYARLANPINSVIEDTFMVDADAKEVTLTTLYSKMGTKSMALLAPDNSVVNQVDPPMGDYEADIIRVERWPGVLKVRRK
ncbi:unnamed protein product [Cyprideis torosa]|uniref:Calcium-activated chloride channel N-terminal domain-containing protein n=1 Tax=Cyprideis torosa TaxID=163714 RepID=A0A7R8W256_9CRUS|nr:unnamed protein product [Cyprideis torosa]CAG0880619.1 unnamed protein product [Cyprideis torosa]